MLMLMLMLMLLLLMMMILGIIMMEIIEMIKIS